MSMVPLSELHYDPSMKILQVGKYFPPYRGGMETVLENLSLGLMDRGHQIHVLVAGLSDLDRTSRLPGSPSLQGGGLVAAANLGTVQSQPLTPTIYSLLRRELAHFQPDLVHLHFPNPLLAGAWWLGRHDPIFVRPALAVWHHAEITRQRIGGLLVAPLVNEVLASAQGICVSSDNLIGSSRSLVAHRAKVAVIPFGIQPEPWLEIPSAGKEFFLFMGRLVPYKGIEILLEALGKLPAARLVIAGDGPQKNQLAALIREWGLVGRVDLVGQVSEVRLQELLSHTRALVLPSTDRSETFGLVQLEAMAAGVPVIASDLPTGVSGVGQEGQTGLLVPPGDVQAWSEAMQAMLDDDARAVAMGQAARRYFLAHYTRDHMLDTLEAWYAGFPPRG